MCVHLCECLNAATQWRAVKAKQVCFLCLYMCMPLSDSACIQANEQEGHGQMLHMPMPRARGPRAHRHARRTLKSCAYTHACTNMYVVEFHVQVGAHDLEALRQRTKAMKVCKIMVLSRFAS
jgi:hypothetical protein